MPSSPPTEAPAAAFVCDCDASVRSACEGLPFYKKHEDKQYCVLHFPSEEKRADFNEAIKSKLEAKDFNFGGVWFPDSVDFNGFTFTALANFGLATFNAEASFVSATFNTEARFYLTEFRASAYFVGTKFDALTSFAYTKFNAPALFVGAEFGAQTNFGPTFNAAAFFTAATFKDYVRFRGEKERPIFTDKSSLDLQSIKVDKPDRFSFHTVKLRPHWFVNVDARKFEFIDVRWNWPHVNVGSEIKSLEQKNVSSSHSLLAIACRNLAVNAEENHRYEEASRFRYMAMEARRLELWRGFAFWTLGWWYWLASGYGERVWRAFVMLIGVWLVAAALYTQVGFARWEPRVSSEKEAAEAKRDEIGEPLPGLRPLTHSFAVMTLQKPEPRPATNAAQAVVMMETILGPVQAALLALAIRRKFMR
jgi:hypothetical protein